MNKAPHLLMGLYALPTFSVSAALVAFAGSPKSWVVRAEASLGFPFTSMKEKNHA
ncbi:hypothetical protein [Marinobacter psychrophilus]|jgi:hypothetical protein|uniref:hypothetical protein n=1 Tax=Marinobacter psychrophilus TaxID=330734 RepID=UPI001B705638|nr:hypothetical protein [Marinobacter psychrophilus]MBQ0844066.1 hypothetical protein [Marinobacter psychrophilus]